MTTDDDRYTSAYWRGRAEEARSRAEELRDGDDPQGHDYRREKCMTRMATRAEEREAKGIILPGHLTLAQ